jgi:histidine triad (HIT) family protein
MPVRSSDCLFCKIVAEEVSADVIHESDHVMAIRDINPQAPTHILLIPKDHIESAAELTEDQEGVLMELVRSAAHLAEAEGVRDGWRLVTNVGPEAGQSVPHLHFHLLGGRRMSWPPG